MLYNNIFFLTVFIILSNCTTGSLIVNKSNLTKVNVYSNKGFALIYNDQLLKKKIINEKIDERSLVIIQKNLEINSLVKVTNLLNEMSLIAKVVGNSYYPKFNNSVLSERIAKELKIEISQPYVKITKLKNNSIFIAKKAKTFNEEKTVANKAPVANIIINNLKKITPKSKKIFNNKFSYEIKIADFYFNSTAKIMIDRIIKETTIVNPKIRKINKKKYRVYLGPFDNINTLQKSYNDVDILDFENIEVIKND